MFNSKAEYYGKAHRFVEEICNETILFFVVDFMILKI
jgi:hypothetical protein